MFSSIRCRSIVWLPWSLCVAFILTTGCEDQVPTEPNVEDAGHTPHNSATATNDSGPVDAAPSDAGSTPEAPPTPMTPPPTHYFEDMARSSGITWEREASEAFTHFADRFNGGLCALDADHEPPLDLFFPARGRGASRLFTATEAFSYEDRTERYGLTEIVDAVACLVYDADGDRDDDLLVMGMGSFQLFTNNGDGFDWEKFIFNVTPQEDVLYASASAADLDGDQDLDLLISGSFRDNPDVAPTDVCLGNIPCTAEIGLQLAGSNLVFIRDDAQYVDRTEIITPSMQVEEPTLVLSVGRLIGGDIPMIYVGNDFGSRYVDRALVQQADGHFEDQGRVLGLATNWQGHGIDTMGFTSIDADRDGRLEHVVTAFEGYITSYFDCDPGYCEDMSRTIGFRDRAFSFRWSPVFVDVDQDGWPELFETTGHYYRAAEIPEIGFRGEETQIPNFYINQRERGFAPYSPTPEDALSVLTNGRGAIRIDLDDDGRPDIAAIGVEGRPQLLRNVVSTPNHFINLQLEGRAPNTQAIGALVSVETREGTQLQEVRAGEGYMSSFDRRLFFGLGLATDAIIKITWPDGSPETLELSLDALDQTLTVRESAAP